MRQLPYRGQAIGFIMFGILKKLFGAGKTTVRDEGVPAIRETVSLGGERQSRFEEFERETRERLEAQSYEMPGQAYFSQLQALQESISDRRYMDAATAARKSLPLIRKWLEDPRGNGKRFSLNMPALTQGGTMLAITGDRAAAHLDDRYDTFAPEGRGIRCVSDRPWITTAETCECAMAYLAVGMHDRARELFAHAQTQRLDDGHYWTGIVYPQEVHFPAEETSTYSAAAVLLAADALDESSPSAALFTDHDAVLPVVPRAPADCTSTRPATRKPSARPRRPASRLGAVAGSPTHGVRRRRHVTTATRPHGSRHRHRHDRSAGAAQHPERAGGRHRREVHARGP